MSGLLLLSERQMARISSFFPLSHGVQRVDNRQVIHLRFIEKLVAGKPAERQHQPEHEAKICALTPISTVRPSP
jgi:hypothetical protein